MSTARQPGSKNYPAQTEIFLEVLQQVERVDSEFPLNYSICLAHIALNEGLSLTQLAEKTGLGLSTISRIVAAMSDFRPNGQSYGLIDLKVSPQERRRKELTLTPKGWTVIRSVGAVLENYRTAKSA
jgi:DNA-binding MarR family transcriptional regulator